MRHFYIDQFLVICLDEQIIGTRLSFEQAIFRTIIQSRMILIFNIRMINIFE
jgi:hypothetical protein